MTRTHRALLVGVAAALIAGPALSDDREAREPVPLLPGFWETDLAAGRTKARKENKPLLVVFRCLP